MGFSFQPEEFIDAHPQHAGESERQEGRGAVLAGLDRADRLAADSSRLRQLVLRQIALGTSDPEAVPEPDIGSGRHAARVNQPAFDVK
jgi:hypothetical protein